MEPTREQEMAIDAMDKAFDEMKAQQEEKKEEPKPLPAWTKKHYNVVEKELPGREGVYMINRSCKHCYGTGIIGTKVETAARYTIYCSCPIKKEEPKEEETN